MKKLQNMPLLEVLEQCKRPKISNEQIYPLIDDVFREVEQKGDEAIKKYTRFFDQVDLDVLEVSTQEIGAADAAVSDDLKAAIQLAKKNIELFHASQSFKKEIVETTEGVLCWQESRAIDKVGIYIPGGTAPLFSTVLMLAVPAKLAGCKEVILCTPPDKNGKVNPAILYAARLTGVTKLYKVGGAQAIAGLTFGTESIPQVYKIFGPGNQYVTCAKNRAQQFGIAIDMPAGPSELLLVADDSAVPSFVASDLLSQAEHGPDSQVICLADSKALLEKIQVEIELQLLDLPRKEIVLKALDNSVFIVSPSFQYTYDFINEYAPEHLILATKEGGIDLSEIRNVGSVFIGNNTPESAGDYASGTNHTLPTAGAAKAFSGVNLDAFSKKITVQQISEKGIKNLGASIELMAEAEQLQAHKNAVTLRLKALEL